MGEIAVRELEPNDRVASWRDLPDQDIGLEVRLALYRESNLIGEIGQREIGCQSMWRYIGPIEIDPDKERYWPDRYKVA